MSRPGQLPPRCPIQKKQMPNTASDLYSSSSPIESYIGSFKSPPQNPTLEDPPAWLDELLGEKTDGNAMGGPLRRSASDSVVLMGDFMNNLSAFNSSEDEDCLVSEVCAELESACVYGPNSPRKRNSPSFSNNTIASAFSDYDNHKSFHNIDDAVIRISNPNLADNGSIQISTTPNSDTRNTKRNPGQRSRVRKLQHIAELERTVAMFQTMEADLSVKVASLLQKRAVLSLENSQLKQKMAILKQDKLLREGEYHTLKKEAQRLKMGMGSNTNKLMRTYSGPKAASSQMDWKMLDMTKLNLN